MLKDGEKGAVLQRDKTTYAIVPQFPLGVLTPEDLRKVADVAQKYQVSAIKLTSANRIALVGIKEQDIDSAWADLGTEPAAAIGACVRSIKVCPGTTFCRLGQQDSLGLGGVLDKKYHGFSLPSKFKIGVSGCANQCAESSVKDLGFIGKKNGWTVMIGGNAASRPKIASLLVEGVSTDEALALAERVIHYYKENGKKGERIGKFVERIGLETLQNAVVSEQHVQV